MVIDLVPWWFPVPASRARDGSFDSRSWWRDLVVRCSDNGALVALAPTIGLRSQRRRCSVIMVAHGGNH